MFCRFCGKEIADGSSFCKFCGKRLLDEAGKVAVESAVLSQGKEERRDAALGGGLNETVPKNEEKSSLLHRGGHASVGGTVFIAIFFSFLTVFLFSITVFFTFVLLPLLYADGMWTAPVGILLRLAILVLWVLVLGMPLKTLALVLTRSLSHVNVYEDRVEGVSGVNRAPIPVIRRFVLSRDEILDAKRAGLGLHLVTKTGAKYFVMTPNEESAARVYELLMRSSHHIDD